MKEITGMRKRLSVFQGLNVICGSFHKANKVKESHIWNKGEHREEIGRDRNRQHVLEFHQ